MAVEHWDPVQDGELSEAALWRKLERRGYAVTRYVYPSGTCFPEHTHAVDKIDAVVSGRFRLTTHHVDAVLTAGDCLTVPHGVLHRAEVVGDEPVICLDASRSPREPD
ncbi:MAG: cupin domain-containing protein [Acidobacteriota bacterium]|nr:cupin domain-containing protein [Acidobacteriota bacterium]